MGRRFFYVNNNQSCEGVFSIGTKIQLDKFGHSSRYLINKVNIHKKTDKQF